MKIHIYTESSPQKQAQLSKQLISFEVQPANGETTEKGKHPTETDLPPSV